MVITCVMVVRVESCEMPSGAIVESRSVVGGDVTIALETQHSAVLTSNARQSPTLKQINDPRQLSTISLWMLLQ